MTIISHGFLESMSGDRSSGPIEISDDEHDEGEDYNDSLMGPEGIDDGAGFVGLAHGERQRLALWKFWRR